MVTINDIVLKPGHAHEKRRPFEIFINSRTWTHSSGLALTRVIFRRVRRAVTSPSWWRN